MAAVVCRVRKAFNIVLSTSLVHLYPPKHHARALRIIDEILDVDSHNIPTLMSRGYVHEYANQWVEARDVFFKVTELTGNEDDAGVSEDETRAKEEYAWCDVQLGELEKGAEGLQAVIEMIGDEVEGKEEDKARCWWRLGKAHWEMGGKSSGSSSLHCRPTHFILPCYLQFV